MAHDGDWKCETWPVRFDGKPPELKSAPKLRQHTDEVIASWLKMGPSDLAKLKSEKIIGNSQGYTLLLSSNSPIVNLPLLRRVPYDLSSLQPVVRVGDAATGFCVHPSTGLNSVKELVDYARANPEKLVCCSGGVATSSHMRMEMLAYRTGVKFLHVPYRGGADALIDLLAGTVHFMNDPSTNPSAKAGKLKMLCVNHSTRSPEFPDAPTLTEAGYPNSDVTLWFCIYAPAGTPQPIVEALHAKVTEISKEPDVPARLLLSGSLPVTSTHAELLAFRDVEWKTTGDLIKAANIKLE